MQQQQQLHHFVNLSSPNKNNEMLKGNQQVDVTSSRTAMIDNGPTRLNRQQVQQHNRNDFTNFVVNDDDDDDDEEEEEEEVGQPSLTTFDFHPIACFQCRQLHKVSTTQVCYM